MAQRLFAALCRGAAGEPVYLDLPEVDPSGMRFAQRENMPSVRHRAHVHRGIPRLPLEAIYGVTTFELG